MNCLYCQQPTTKIATTITYKEKQCHYQCPDCQFYFYYVDEQLDCIYFYPTIQNKTGYQLRMSIKDQITELSFFDKSGKVDTIFRLNQVPNWTPSNIQDKLAMAILLS